MLSASRTGAREALLAAVGVGRSDSDVQHGLDGADADALVALARRHRVAALVHDRLSTLQSSAAIAVTRRLKTDRIAAQVRHMQARRVVRELQASLDVPFLLFKGAALATGWYDDPATRIYVDVDVLVPRRHFGVTVDALERSGFVHAAPNWEPLLRMGMAEVPLRTGGLGIDLHWHVVARARPRQELCVDEEALFRRARPIDLGGTTAPTFDDIDTLVHLCINAGLDGARRLQQLVDVDRVVRSGRIDWSEFTARSTDMRAHALCSVVLLRCRDLLRTPAPPIVISGLAPYPGWLAVNRIVNQGRRSDRRLQKGIASGIFLASGRSTLWGTLRSVVHNVHDALQDRPCRGRRPRTADPRSRTPEHDRLSRQRYRAWVERSTLAA